jgi:L-fucose isomerase
LITISDNREKAHNMLLETNKKFEDYVTGYIREKGDIDLVVSEKIVHTAKEANDATQYMLAQNVDGVIMNFTIWVYPNLAVMIARNINKPLLMLSNLHPERAGLVGMMASAGSLDQLGIRNDRVWGDIARPEVYGKVLKFANAAKVKSALEGRSMGMYTGVAEQSVWMKKFGVDCEHIDEMEILRLAGEIAEDRIENAFEWLSRYVWKINYNNEGLTKKKLRLQIACYLATKDMIRERGLDFVGIKCQPEMGNHFVTQCLSQAFLNDPYDMEGEKESVVCACENDMDGALTMQILHLLTGRPTLFFDVRHYD